MTTFSIPTAARGFVRAYVKSLPGFDAFADSLGVASRDVKNADLLAFAEQHGKMDEVKALIERATNTVSNDFVVSVPRDAEIIASLIPAEPVAEAFVLDTLLRDVDQFLSPVVKRELEKALLPVVQAANKPAVVNTVEKVVTVEAQPTAPTGSVPYAIRTGGKVPFAKLFSVNTSHAFGKSNISMWDAHGYAPALDPYYVVDAVNMALIATAAEHETNVWQYGPSGSGKSTQPKQFAAYTGRPFAEIFFTRQTEVGSLIGAKGFKDGATYWEDGGLIAAMRRPGTVIVLNEPTIAPAGVQAIIQAVTDDARSYTIHETGEVVKCAPGVFFVVADNTNGSGDETGQYAGTNQSNAALVNRFKRMVKVEYMSKKQETVALVNHTNIPWAAAEHVTNFVARARKLPEMEGIVLSLRQMVGFVNTVKDGFDAKVAFDVAILSRLPSTERAAIETLATLQWTDMFENLLNGTAPAVEPSNSPSNTPASNAFDDEVSASLNR